MEKGGLVFFLPTLKDIIPEWSGYNGSRRQIGTFRETFTNAVREHKETYAEDFQRDFIDVFLKEMKSCSNPTSAFYKELGGNLTFHFPSSKRVWKCHPPLVFCFRFPYFRETISGSDCGSFYGWNGHDSHHPGMDIPLPCHFSGSAEKVTGGTGQCCREFEGLLLGKSARVCPTD